MKRRDFLKLGLMSAVLAACERLPQEPRVGIALGGGGAKGLAHVPMLAVLDELGIRPHRIAGTSIGALIGALYAAGMSAKALAELVDQLTVSGKETWLGALVEQDVSHWWDLIELQLGRGGLMDTEAVVRFMEKTIGAKRFADLQIPLAVVATDFWSREQVVFEKGPLAPALQASIALPGLFSPVHYQDRVLVDGGLVNPVPWDLLADDCDLVIAIDVSGSRTPQADNGPSYTETVFNTYQILQASIVREKRRYQPPDIYIAPELNNIRVLEFNRVDEINAHAASAARELKRELQKRYVSAA
jgi:NTE family protein